MSIRKLAAAIVAVLALAGLVANSASATVSTTAAEWYTGTAPGTTLSVGTTKAATASTSVVNKLTASLLGAPVELDATGSECVGCVIRNEAVTGNTQPAAVGEGKIKFTGVTVTQPTGCTVETAGVNSPGTVETKLLKVHAIWMDTNSANQHVFVQVFPATGTVFASLRFTGTFCPLSGPYNFTGSFFGESANDTGVQAAIQGLSYNSAVQSTAGASLFFGERPATLTGSANFEAGGALFGIH